jgi:predicted dehydrogenase
MTGQSRARIAVVGAGSWSTEAHMPAVAAHPDADVVGVADPAADARRAVAQRYPETQLFESHEKLLSTTRPDGVVVATPHAHHYEPARAALEAGAHVLVEKPMVLDPAEGRELQRIARARARELIVGYTWHYNRQAIELRERIRAGTLGAIELASCHFASMVREYYRGDTDAYQPELKLLRAPRSTTYSDPALAGGGQGQAQVTHSAALLFWLTGLRPRRVSALCRNFGLELDIVDVAVIEFDGGPVGTVSSTGDRPAGHQDMLRLQICGTHALAEFDVMEGVVSVHLPGGRTELLDPVPPADRYPHLEPATNLVDVVLGRAANGSDAEIGCLTVEFLAAMYQSSAAGGEMRGLGFDTAPRDEADAAGF